MTSTTDLSDTKSAARRPVPSYPQIVRIMNPVSKEVEIAEIEDQIKADPVISYRLMTYINSAAMGFTREIKSFRQVIAIHCRQHPPPNSHNRWPDPSDLL